jgi:energy-coupling factor transport system ATP-binding protein
VIEFDRVTYCYPDQTVPALADFSTRIRPGEFVLVVGPSGAGKSTFLRCLNGLVPHFFGGRWAGQARVFGSDPVTMAPRGMSGVVGFVFQDPEAQAVVDTVEDEVAFALENHSVPQQIMRKRVEEALDQMHVAHLRRRRMSTLSGGERQRVAIASVLALQPELLVLDEPTSQLDPQSAEEVLLALRQLNEDLGLTVVLSEHRLERVIQYADRILYLPGGGAQPVLGTPRDVMDVLPMVPPLVQLGRALGWRPLPLTIKEGRSFARQTLARIAEMTEEPEEMAPAARPSGPSGVVAAFTLRDVHYAYGAIPALRGLNLVGQRGEFVALMGRNGSGKSTLLKHLAGLLRPQRGDVTVAGLDTRSVDVAEIIKHIGYVPQQPSTLLFNETLLAELQFTRRSRGLPADEAADRALLERLGLGDAAERDPRDLSGGEQQRAALAAVLVGDPELLLLDEPTRGLDYGQKQILADVLVKLKRDGHTIVMATHDVELVAECADRVVLMGEGEAVVNGPARRVMTDSQLFSSQINKLLRDPRFLTPGDVLRHVVH